MSFRGRGRGGRPPGYGSFASVAPAVRLSGLRPPPLYPERELVQPEPIPEAVADLLDVCRPGSAPVGSMKLAASRYVLDRVSDAEGIDFEKAFGPLLRAGAASGLFPSELVDGTVGRARTSKAGARGGKLPAPSTGSVSLGRKRPRDLLQILDDAAKEEQRGEGEAAEEGGQRSAGGNRRRAPGEEGAAAGQEGEEDADLAAAQAEEDDLEDDDQNYFNEDDDEGDRDSLEGGAGDDEGGYY